jgi:hypothetical protein
VINKRELSLRFSKQQNSHECWFKGNKVSENMFLRTNFEAKFLENSLPEYAYPICLKNTALKYQMKCVE